MPKQDDRMFREMGVGEIVNIGTGQVVCQVSVTGNSGSDFRDVVDLICDALNERYYPSSQAQSGVVVPSRPTTDKPKPTPKP